MQLATDKSPKLTIPFRYLFTGMAVLCLLSLAIMFESRALTGHFFRSPVFLPLTHLLTLGWITLTIMGAMFQLIPVVTEKVLFSESVAKLVYYLYLAGLGLLVYAFASNTSADAGAAVISIAILLFLVDTAMTMYPSGRRNCTTIMGSSQSPADTKDSGHKLEPPAFPIGAKGMRKPDIAVRYITTAAVFLFLTVLIGSLAAAGLHHHTVDNPAALLSLHIAVAGIGWVCFVVIGFSFRLIPMFVLSHGYDESYGRTSFVMLLSGLSLLVLFFLLYLLIPSISGIHWVGFAGGIIMLIGIVSYILQMRVIYKQRTRSQIEPALWFSICAMIYLLIGGVIGLWILTFRHSFRLEIVYVFAGLFGFAGMYIIGMMHKIVPFLHWYNKYSSKIGLEKVPMTKDLISTPLTWFQLSVFNAGIILFAAGILTGAAPVIFISGIVLFSGSAVFLWNIANVLRK